MRNTFILFCTLIPILSFGQITLELQHTKGFYAPVKLSSSGTKYIEMKLDDSLGIWDINLSQQLKLLNLDGTTYKLINLPSKPHYDAYVDAVFYVSETLFDLDSTNLEYMIQWQWYDTLIPGIETKIQIVREDGTILLDELNCMTFEVFTTGKYYSVYETEEGTKLQLYYYDVTTDPSYVQTKIFSLIGNYPTDVNLDKTTELNDFSIFPNPNNGTFFIKNPFDKDTRIDFYNLNGEKIKSISNSSISSLTEFSNGVYLVRIFDKIKKQFVTRKIIIEK